MTLASRSLWPLRRKITTFSTLILLSFFRDGNATGTARVRTTLLVADVYSAGRAVIADTLAALGYETSSRLVASLLKNGSGEEHCKGRCAHGLGWTRTGGLGLAMSGQGA